MDKNNFHIEINTNISGVRSLNIGDFREFVDFYHNHIKKYEFANLPIIAQYTVNRNIEATNINLSLNFAYSKFIGYQNFWNAGSEYSSFFQWFKDFEDLENENNRNLSYKFDEMMQIQSEIEKLLQSKEHYMDIDDFESDEDKFNILANISKQIEEKREHYTTMKLRNIVIASSLQNNIQLPLQYVRQAIELFTDFKNIRIERQGTPKMVVEKDGEKLDVNQLSQGEKSLLALVGDIARRLAILNPSFDNPLQGEGVVLIDEVDLHLHPKWQQNLVDKLTKTFPNVQFILTTHSPHIVSDNPDVLVYILDNGQLKQYHNAYGEDANTLLNGVFGVSERTQEIAEKFKLIGDYIADKQLDNAKNLIDELSKILPKNNTQLLSTQLSWAKAKLAQSKEV